MIDGGDRCQEGATCLDPRIAGRGQIRADTCGFLSRQPRRASGGATEGGRRGDRRHQETPQ
jgi:hypothetical protein